MIKHTSFQQNSLAWLEARRGIPTASEFGNLVTPKWKIREGGMVESYLAAKVAEAWTGKVFDSINSFDMESGNLMQDEAIPWLEFKLDKPIKSVGFCTTDDGKVGCSPDGMMDDAGCEVKCPRAHTQVRYLLDGVVPDDYLPQVHGSMYVTGFKTWHFLSYRRDLPKLHIVVQRDEAIQKVISDAVDAFRKRFDAAIARLVELNGGRPITRMPRSQTPPPQPQLERIDIIP